MLFMWCMTTVESPWTRVMVLAEVLNSQTAAGRRIAFELSSVFGIDSMVY